MIRCSICHPNLTHATLYCGQTNNTGPEAMSIQAISDKAAISLSLLCSIHCLLLPVALVLIPTLASLPMGEEAFHKWMLVAVIPISIFALTMGCKKHKRYQLFYYGLAGIVIMTLAAFFGHDIVGETGEKVATVIGSLVIVYGHFLNHRLCNQHQCQTECHSN